MPVASRALIGSYLALIAAAVCEMTIPGVLWQPSPPWLRAGICALLAAGFLGSFIHGRTIRAVGWTGIVLFAGLLIWNIYFADIYISIASMEDFPTGSHAAQYKWRGFLFVAHAALLAVCYRMLGASARRTSKRFQVILGGLLMIVGVGFVLIKLAMPPMGYIAVHYDGKSTSGVFLLLENRSSQAVYLDSLEQNAATCSNIDTTESDSPAIADGFRTFIRIAPGEQFRILASTELPSKFKRGHCHVRVPILGGTWVESDEFSPE